MLWGVCVCVGGGGGGSTTKNITEMFSHHPNIICTSLYFDCFVLILQTTHFFFVVFNVHLKQISYRSYRKAIKSLIQSHFCSIFLKWSGGAMVLG